jgi:beta-glucosidase
MAVAFIEGVQSRGVLASAKHFAANSIEDSRHRVDVRMDERTLREVYLPHFRRAVVEARVASVMSAYNRSTATGATRARTCCGTSPRASGASRASSSPTGSSAPTATSSSVRAGLDIEMPIAAQLRRLPARIAAGEISEREIDDSRPPHPARAALLRPRRPRPSSPTTPRAGSPPEHLALAREVARRGMVLLRNERTGSSRAALGAERCGLVVLGRNADVENLGDRGSSNVSRARW